MNLEALGWLVNEDQWTHEDPRRVRVGQSLTGTTKSSFTKAEAERVERSITFNAILDGNDENESDE